MLFIRNSQVGLDLVFLSLFVRLLEIVLLLQLTIFSHSLVVFPVL